MGDAASVVSGVVRDAGDCEAAMKKLLLLLVLSGCQAPCAGQAYQRCYENHTCNNHMRCITWRASDNTEVCIPDEQTCEPVGGAK